MNIIDIALSHIGDKAQDLGYSTEWCAAFVTDIISQAGIKNIGSTSCTRLREQAAQAGCLHKGCEGIRPGDIVLYQFDSDDYADHTGIVTAVDTSGITAVEGNVNGTYWTNTEVAIKNRAYSLIDSYIRLDHIVTPSCRPSVPELSEGSRTKTVSYLQILLCLHGYAVDVDAVFGPQTTTAVRALQQDSNIDVDGVVGCDTWSKLLGG